MNQTPEQRRPVAKAVLDTFTEVLKPLMAGLPPAQQADLQRQISDAPEDIEGMITDPPPFIHMGFQRTGNWAQLTFSVDVTDPGLLEYIRKAFPAAR